MGAWHDAIFDVLVEECGSRGDRLDRDEFAYHFPECVEFRFIGALGFGGKVWSDRGRLYVTCYPEDETPKRRRMIDRANARLAALAPGPGLTSPSDADPASSP